jgi:hypothetical protein
VDEGAEFVFVDDPDEVPADATPFDMQGVELSHHDGDCSFEAFLRRYELHDPILWDIAKIVHEADLADELYDAPGARSRRPAAWVVTDAWDDELLARRTLDGLYEFKTSPPARPGTVLMAGSSHRGWIQHMHTLTAIRALGAGRRVLLLGGTARLGRQRRHRDPRYGRCLPLAQVGEHAAAQRRRPTAVLGERRLLPSSPTWCLACTPRCRRYTIVLSQRAPLPS